MKKIGRLLVNMLDGTGYGPRTVEIGNWVGRALFAPKKDLAGILDRAECSKTGLYVLKYAGDAPYTEKVYIGEADNLRDRLKQHLGNATRSNFIEAILFLSHNEWITKTQAKYLEHRLIAIARATGSQIINSNSPSQPNVPEAEKEDLEEFLDCIQVILPIMGFRFLLEPGIVAEQKAAAVMSSSFVMKIEEANDEIDFAIDDIPLPSKENPDAPRVAAAPVGHAAERFERISPVPELPVTESMKMPSDDEGSIELFEVIVEGTYEVVDAVLKARMVVRNGEYVVLKGSQARNWITPSLSETYALLRKALISHGVLVEDGNTLLFTKDCPFSSASAASNIVLGRQSPGPRMWVDADKRSLRGIINDSVS